MMDARRPEPDLRDFETLTFGAEQIFAGHPHLIEGKLGARVSQRVSEQFIVERVRKDTDRQYVPLRAQIGLSHRGLIRVAQLMEQNIEKPLSLATRDGSFMMDAQGRVVTAQGNPGQPTITIPQNSSQITINTQVGSQWDGLRHWGHTKTGMYYGGIKHEDLLKTERLGIDSELPTCRKQREGKEN